MISKIIIYLNIIFNSCILLGNGNDSTSISLTLTSNDQIKKVDSTIIYDELIIHEDNNLFQDLYFIRHLHFKSFIYYGRKRQTFPDFRIKKKELLEIQILGRSIERLPNFIDSMVIESIVVESNSFHVDKSLVGFVKLRILMLNCLNNTSDKVIVSQITGLKELTFYTRKPICLKENDLLFNLKKIESISLNINQDCIYMLENFKFLKKIYFTNKLSFRIVKNNELFLKKLERINLSYRTKTSEIAKIKTVLPNIW
jgi:hypothetical protein